MPENPVVRARIDEHIKEEASVVLAAMGLTVSGAFRLFLTRVAHEKALPFDLLVQGGRSSIPLEKPRSIS